MYISWATLLLNLLHNFRLPLTRSKNQIRKSQFCSSSFFPDKHSSKTILSMWILYIPNECSTTSHLPFMVCDGVPATSVELWPRNRPPVCKTLMFIDVCGFCLRVPSVACIVRRHRVYWNRALQCVTCFPAGNCQQAEVSLFTWCWRPS